MSKYAGLIIGGIEIAVGALLAIPSFGASLGLTAAGIAALSGSIIAAGVGSLLTGVGTLISGSGGGNQSQQPGFSTAVRNPIAAWVIPYGRCLVGGTVVHIHEFGDQNKYLDLVIVLAARPCAGVDRLLFDGKFIQLDDNGDSFTPVQQTVNITHIVRAKGVTTCTMQAAIPLLQPGDKVIVQDISADRSLNGTVPVESVSSDQKTFTYINGGNDTTVDLEGIVKTIWADFGRKVHMEVLAGDHTNTFPGMLSGTANDGDTTDLIVCPNNPWTSEHRLLGKCCVFLRLHYNDTYFSGGLPQIGFLIRGAKDVYDPRSGTTGYTENAALCIADYLSNTSYGFKAAYGTEIPTTQLIAAANICDEDVAVAIGGFEPRYALNGKFDLTVKRGEVLQNMLTACAGRLTYQGGQFIIWPAAWNGSTAAPSPGLGAMSGPFRWKSTVSIRDLYNGVKGTYISPANNWQASDIPPYAQDSTHGYSSGPLWSNGTSYVIGNIVHFSGVGYIALAAGSGHQPDISTSYWAIHYQDQNLTADGGDRRWLDIQLPFTISTATAQRLCKIELLRRRHQGTGTFRFNMAGYGITAMDVISMTIPYMGWSGKLLEVLAHRFTLDKQSGEDGIEVTLLGTEVDVQETDASVFDWSDTEELTPQGYQQTAVPDARTPKPPTGLTLISDESTTVVTPRGLADSILVTWDAPTDGYVLNGGHMELQYELIEQYTVGSLAATTGSTLIVGSGGTAWTSDMDGETIVINGASYAIGTVSNASHMTLATPFLGATASGLFYTIALSSAWIGLPSVNPSVTEVHINGVIDGEQYNVQIRSVNAGGTPSEWVEAGPVRAEGARVPSPYFPYAQHYFFAPHGYGIGLAQIGGNSGTNSISIKGARPVNVLSTVDAPVIDPYGVVSTGGSPGLPGAQFVAQVFGIDASGKRTAGSNYTQFISPAFPSKATITVNWGAGTTGYEVFVSDRNGSADTLIGLGPQTGTPSSISIETYGQFGYGVPDTRAVSFHARAKRVIHGGIGVGGVVAQTSNTVTINVPNPPTADLWAGRWLMLISKTGLPDTQTYSVHTILHNDTGSPNCVLTLPPAEGGLFSVGDLVMVMTSATSVTSTSITDTKWEGPFAPGGLDPGASVGNLIRVIYDPTGTARVGDTARITGNTSNSHTVTPFRVPPGVGTVFIEEEPTWRVDVVTTAIENSVAPDVAPDPEPLVDIPSALLGGYVALVELMVQDEHGNDSLELGDGVRMLYIVPPPDTTGGAGDPVGTMTPGADGSFTPDLGTGLAFRGVLTQDARANAPINIPIGEARDWSLEFDEDSTGGHSIILDPSYNCNYVMNSSGSPATTRCVVFLRTDQSGNTYPTSPPTIDQPIP